jgi:hypothetical protein
MAGPVLEIYDSDGFALWAVAESEPYAFMPLTGALRPVEIGTAVRRIAQCNDVERDLNGFLSSATTWATRHLPRHHASPVVATLARALDLPGPQSCGARAQRRQVP